MSGAFTVNSNISSPVKNTGNKLNTSNSVGRQNLVGGGKLLPQSEAKAKLPPQVVTPGKETLSTAKSSGSKLQFEVNQATKDAVIMVRNAETGELVRQIPTKEKIAISRYIAETSPDRSPGQLVDDSE